MPSRQRKHGGGKFKSEKQRKYLWATHPRAAKDWAHGQKTTKGDWVAGGGGRGRGRGK